jgi:diacylglycerol kinase (ATP)
VTWPEAAAPPVAILPLGTGNDLARALGWGASYSADMSLDKVLARVLHARTTRLDRWLISTQPIITPNNSPPATSSSSSSSSSNTRKKAAAAAKLAVSKLSNNVMNNYFSLGCDAHVCLEFHERREANHDKFSSRWFNLLQYAEVGGRDQIKKAWRNLCSFVELECDGRDYTQAIRARGYHCIIFLNINKYSGGTNPWGGSSSNGGGGGIISGHNNNNAAAAISSPEQTRKDHQLWGVQQSMNDGMLEVVGIYTSTLTRLQMGGAGERICQARRVTLTTRTCIPMQVDGEPYRLCPSRIHIEHKNKALMLQHLKYKYTSLFYFFFFLF